MNKGSFTFDVSGVCTGVRPTKDGSGAWIGLRLGMMEDAFEAGKGLLGGLGRSPVPGDDVRLSGSVTYRQFGGNVSKRFVVENVVLGGAGAGAASGGAVPEPSLDLIKSDGTVRKGK